MEIPDSMRGSCMADCSVGSIVWVRRRNGSWWPGRILGPNELSASHLMSPRSGTPVKLLGREDASVDWYNLEKSKRVKVFRCGEFDDCIQRAEASQVVSIKKREKYARREDAILHALELEKLQLEKIEQKLGVASNCTGGKMPAVVKQELHTHLENLGSDHCKLQSLEDESMDNPLFSQKDEKSELIPRMRGLQDFGLRIAPKRKLSSFEGSRKLCAVDSHLLPGNNMGDENHSINSSSLAVNRKRSEGGIAGESLVKRRDRRRPLVQVLQSSAKLLPGSQSLHLDSGSVSIPTTGEEEHREFIFRAKRSTCVYLPSNSNIDYTECPQDQSLVSPSQSGKGNNSLQTGSLAEENIFSELLEDTESDSAERNSVDPDKMEDERTQLSDTTEMQTLVEPRSMGRCRIQGRIRDVSGEELKESMVTGFPHNQAAPISADVGVSKWKLKGKRNIRNLTKRPVEVMDGIISYGSIHGVYLEGKGNSLNQRAFKQGSYYRREELCYSYDEDDFINRNSPWTKFSEFGNRRYLVPSKATYTNYSDPTDSEEDYAWEANGPSQSGLRGYREDSDECLDPLCFDDYHGKGIDSKLLDVDLKVQASYQGEHVPLVSLMSRFNGKAIIGHPIQIEALENGSSTFLLSRNDDFSNDPVNNDESTTPTPVWSTGRRSAMHRVPRPHPSSALEGDETIEPLQFSDPENKSSNKEEYIASHLGHKARLVKNSSHIRRPPMGKKFHKKLLKKANISSQKTRTLSSFAVEEKFSGNSLDPKFVTKCNTNGLIKAVDSGPTAVTCIPVKLVFSRLLEAVGRPPYRAVP